MDETTSIICDFPATAARSGEALLLQRGRAQQAAHAHRLDGAARDEHEHPVHLGT